jgi:hypothetical protein
VSCPPESDTNPTFDASEAAIFRVAVRDNRLFAMIAMKEEGLEITRKLELVKKVDD